MAIQNIRIIDVINTPNAIIQSYGLRVYEVASDYISKGIEISLDFENIENLTSGFCNASIGRLYTEFPDKAKSLINIVNLDTDSFWSEKIDDAIILATNPEKAKQLDDAILSLFE